MKQFKFSSSSTSIYFDSNIKKLKDILDTNQCIFITDENVFDAHKHLFKGYNTIVIKAGEAFKIQATVDTIIQQLIHFNADRNTILIGVGGGVITDLTGYISSIYMRGLMVGFIPTTILALVDASIGGKNGIDVGVYKNMVGIIKQPNFIIHDTQFLKSLPLNEWQNGFAEIIKHACIKSPKLFKHLQKHSIEEFQGNQHLLNDLITENALIKIKVVQKDEFEKGDRKLLNFGHTLGHALENQYELSHGQAISIGMTYACEVSAIKQEFNDTKSVVNLLEKYGLPTYATYNKNKVFKVLQHDKKKEQSAINFILLNKIGKAVVEKINIYELKKII